MNKKIVALILALSFVISCFTACGNNAAGNEGGENSSNTINNAQNGGDASAEPQPAAEQKTLYFGLTGDPVTLDPHMKFDQNAQIMYWNMYSRLSYCGATSSSPVEDIIPYWSPLWTIILPLFIDFTPSYEIDVVWSFDVFII